MRATIINGQLEIDHERGVIYFHSSDHGCSVLRICRLPSPIPQIDIFGKRNLLDIIHMFGTDWDKENSNG